MSSLSMSPGHLPRPIDVLPHRDPFLLVSEVVARWHLTGAEYFWPGHFPGRPTLPGVLILESLAQAGAIAVLSDEKYATKLPLFGGADGVRFRRQVVPGETLELEVTLGRMSSRAGKGNGRATVDGKLACDAEILFVLADR
jgi:3-hydroxyacyl-[acyl-carrier-protein] dehydratase